MAHVEMILFTALLAALGYLTDVSALPDVDISVANLALNLEYLEANFYSCAAYGRVLSDVQLIGDKGVQAMGCSADTVLKLSDKARSYAKAQAAVEMSHVSRLRAVLGAAAVDQPKIDIGPAFTTLLNLASHGDIVKFDPYGDDVSFYLASWVIEDVGITDYKAAARVLKAPAILQAALGILSDEARQGGTVYGLLMSTARRAQKPFGASVVTVVKAISGLLASFGRGNEEGEEDISSSGVAIKEVINRVTFGQVEACKGGFYPDGLNGNLCEPPTPPCVQTPGTQLLANPGFELQGQSWAISQTAPAVALVLRSYAYTGTYSLFVNGDAGIGTARAAQTISTCPGSTYTYSFYVGLNNGGVFAPVGTTFTVSIDGKQLFAPQAPCKQDHSDCTLRKDEYTGYRQVSGTFTASATSHVFSIDFTTTVVPGTGSNQIQNTFLDDVSVTA